MGTETTGNEITLFMSTYKTIDIETWNRKKTFRYFNDFELPYFNITANVDVTILKSFCKEHELSFFLSSLFAMTG